MAMATLREYEADVRQDQTAWLGQLVVFSVNKTLVHHAEISAKLTEGSLADYVPAEPKDENVWRRLFTDGVRLTVKTPTDDDAEASQRVMVRTLERRKGRIVKQVVVETVDVAGHRLGYEPVIEIVFDANTADAVETSTIGSWHPEATQLVEELTEQYLAERGCIDENSVRDIVRRILEDCRATAVRPGGGVYFVNNDFLATVTALEEVGSVIPNCVIHTIPLIDNERQRENIKAAFERESQVELDRLLIEMRDLVRSKADITEMRAASFARESKRAKQRIAEYQALLNDGLDTVDAKIEVFDAVFAQLLNQVK